MLWALLARFLVSKPPWVQAGVLGLCTGLFVAAAAQAKERDPAVGSTAWLVLLWAVAAGAAYYVGFTVQAAREGSTPDRAPPSRLYLVYAAVWLVGLAAALLAFFGAGGFKVAVLAVVPLMLLAPPAFMGMRQVVRRRPPDDRRGG